MPFRRYAPIGSQGGSAEVNDLSSVVTWANVPDANITSSSVIQHVAAIDHDALLNFASNEHFTEASISIPLTQGANDVTALAAELNLLDLSGLTAGWVLSADTATTASWKAAAAGGITGDTPLDVIGDINLATGTNGPTAGAFTAEIQFLDNDETDTAGVIGFQAADSGDLIIQNITEYGDTVFKVHDHNGSGTPFEALRLHKGNSATSGEEGYAMANRGIFNYIGTFTISNDDPPLMVTTGAGEDGQTATYLGIWNNAIQRFTASAAGFASLSINSLGGDVAIGATSGNGGVSIYRDGAIKIGANTASNAVYFPNSSATAPSGGTVGADNALELSTSSQSPIARIGVRASDDVAYLGHDIHSQPWVIEGQNHNGSDRKIMNLYPGDGTDFGVEIGTSASLGAGALWIYEIAASMTDKAGYGQLWVKSDTPNTLYFTDDAGNDHDLTASGGGISNIAAYRGATNVNITTTEATMDLTSETHDVDTNSSVSADVVTVTEAGYYLVSYNLGVSIDSGSGSTHDDVTARCTEGGTTTEIVGSEARAYINEGGSGNRPDTSVTNTFVWNAGASDTIQLRAKSRSGADLSQWGNETYLTLMKIG